MYIFPLIFATSSVAFLPPLAVNTRTRSTKTAGNPLFSNKKINHQSEAGGVPLGRKERYVRLGNTAPITIAQLEEECKDLRGQLRHDLLQLKQKQFRVAKEEDILLQEAVEEIESDRSVLERDVASSETDIQEVRGAAQQAQQKQQQAEKKWSQYKKSWLDSGGHDYRALFGLGEASAEWKNSQEALAFFKETERQTQQREERAKELLQFLDKQEAALKEISMDPEKEQQWAENELSTHHHGSLKAAAMEWETEKLWSQLREDLFELKHFQIQVGKEEESLVAKEGEIIEFETREQRGQIQEAKAAIQRARDKVRLAVAQKEQAYRGTLSTIKAGDADPTLLWKLTESAKYLDESNKAASAAKEALTRLGAEEPQAEDLLTLLKRTGSFLKELRLPGHEAALEKWVKDELSGHETMLDAIKRELIHSDL